MTVPDAATLAAWKLQAEKAIRAGSYDGEGFARNVLALLAALEQAQAEREMARTERDFSESRAMDAEDERDAALARIEQLETALEQVLDAHTGGLIELTLQMSDDVAAALAGGSTPVRRHG